ncbi:hypothetical protein CZ787_12330 [Halomonas citrativorans]|uniref:Uncharacterized protein n=1 Tax=Halomonas citrativorans TaxID=2742612 RepID=A0A1R4I1Z1_9GAMM|nr:hypothetical protein CZ787_12330 [Halomonas citrativorans]
MVDLIEPGVARFFCGPHLTLMRQARIHRLQGLHRLAGLFT